MVGRRGSNFWRGAMWDHSADGYGTPGGEGDPLQLAAFEIIAAQNGRVETLSNQFNEILVECGIARASVSQEPGE